MSEQDFRLSPERIEQELRARIKGLTSGGELICQDAPCHADILLRIANP